MMLVVTANHKALRAPVRAFLDGAEAPDGFFLNIHERPDPYMVGRETIRLAGRSHVREEVLGTSFLISPTAFFQTNVQAARALLAPVLDRVGAVARVPRSLQRQRAVRAAARPCRRARHRHRGEPPGRQGRRGQRPTQPAAAGALRLIPPGSRRRCHESGRERFDAVVLDPPRQGCPDAVIDKCARSMHPGIVYVSCNPEKLASERRRSVSRAIGSRVCRASTCSRTPSTSRPWPFQPASGPARHEHTRTPRPASTVVVLRPRADAFEVLLVRRNDRVAFMAGAFVFPGGRVDPADRSPFPGPALLAEPPRFSDLSAEDERPIAAPRCESCRRRPRFRSMRARSSPSGTG